MTQAAMNRRSLLTPACLRALLEEATTPGDDPFAHLLAARAVLNLANLGQKRETAAYHDDPMSAWAPGECADLVAAPWRRLIGEIDRRVAVLEVEAEALEAGATHQCLHEAIPF